MGFTAIHQDWGRLDSTLDDLGCGRSWADVHRAKGMELTCPECRGQVFARVSQHRARHFYHKVRPPHCALAYESPEHHLLKLELAMAARAAGWHAELEVGSATRDWRADVLVHDDRGEPFMALEAQLSPMTADDGLARTARYARDGVAVCWVALHHRPWQRVVPSLQVYPPPGRGQSWTVHHGMARYVWTPRTLRAPATWEHIRRPLGDAVAWILDGRVRAHTGRDGSVWWTAPAYLDLAVARARLEAEAEAEERAAAAEQARQEAEERARRRAESRALREEQERAEELERQEELARLAGFFAYSGIDPAQWGAFTGMVRDASGKRVFFGDQSRAHGDGLLVHTVSRREGIRRLAGVVCPRPEALGAWPHDLTVLVPGQVWLARIRAAARTPLKVAVLDPTTGHRAFVRVAPDPRPGGAGPEAG
ncbi:competence protein CoiA family protein [Streptomyces sp. HUAS TT3]|uniref:competence protein CoiA n=1 Tax=Streptomyces sp. HUAS TT3 TaxID=3447510 RepID=UPI003F6568D7